MKKKRKRRRKRKSKKKDISWTNLLTSSHDFNSTHSSGNIRPFIVAHRGFSMVRPENSEQAIRDAASLGADAIEVDIQVTKDGIPILLHDSTLKRTTITHCPSKVDDLLYEEILLLDVGDGNPPPTLKRVLEVTHLPFILDLKVFSQEDISAVMRVLQEENAFKRVYVQSPRADVLEKLPTNVKKMVLFEPCIDMTNSCTVAQRATRCMMAKPLCQSLLSMAMLLVQNEACLTLHNRTNQEQSSKKCGFGMNVYVHDFDPSFVKRALCYGRSDLGIDVAFGWTVNTEHTARIAFGIGMDGIVTDTPEAVQWRDRWLRKPTVCLEPQMF